MSLHDPKITQLLRQHRRTLQFCDGLGRKESQELLNNLEAAHNQLAMIKKAWADCSHWPETVGDRRALHNAIIGTEPK